MTPEDEDYIEWEDERDFEEYEPDTETAYDEYPGRIPDYDYQEYRPE